MRDKTKKNGKPESNSVKHSNSKFRIEWKNAEQKMAYSTYQRHDVLFLMGPAGTGKSYLATAFAINDILTSSKKKIIITRPIVEAGESIGYLPGTFEEKVDPYMRPIFDCIDKLCGGDKLQKEKILQAIEIVPLCYMRGRSFDNAICILDEAQNASIMQLKLFLTRFGEDSKIVITGDPHQSDIPSDSVALSNVVNKLESIPGIGIVRFSPDSIVRHPLITKILDKLEQ